MPRVRTQHTRITPTFTDDFPERLKLFKEESDLAWSEIARRIGTYPHTVWRWTEGKTRPNMQHTLALLKLADDLDLGHLFTD